MHSPVMSSENSHIDSAADVSPFTRLGHILNTQQIDEHAESWGADGEEAESLLESLPEETPRLERRAEPSSPFSKRLTSGTIGSTTNGRRTAAKSSPEMSRAAMQARLQSRMVAPAGEDTQEAPLQDLRAMAIRMGPRIEFLHEKASCRPVSTLSSLAQIRVVVQHMECVCVRWGTRPAKTQMPQSYCRLRVATTFPAFNQHLLGQHPPTLKDCWVVARWWAAGRHAEGVSGAGQPSTGDGDGPGVLCFHTTQEDSPFVAAFFVHS